MSTLLYTTILLLPLLAHCQLDPDDEARIDDYMDELMECRGMTGAAIALLKDNEIVLTKGYGYANLERLEPVTSDSMFAIASVSKSLAATLFGKLFTERLRLSWDEVVAWASDEPVYFHNGYVTNHTMFRDLVSHQAGISRHDAMWIYEAFQSREEMVQKSRFLEPYSEFRSDFVYNNIMYALASHPLEVLFNSTFEELLRQYLLDPIGMESTTFYDEAEGSGYEGFVTPYYWDLIGGNPDNMSAIPFDTWRGSYLVGPAASVCSSANDMAKWMQFILNGGVTEDGTRVMEVDDLERLWFPESAVQGSSFFEKPNAPVSYTSEGYDLAYFNGHYRGYPIYTHGGDLTGFHSQIQFMPSMNISYFFTTNFGGITFERDFFMQFFADVLLGLEPAYNATVACDIINSFFESDATVSDNFEEVLPAKSLAVLRSLGYKDEVIRGMVSRQPSSHFQGMPKEVAVEMYDVTERHKSMAQFSFESDEAINRRLENYTGTYGHFAYGNLTISTSAECQGCLAMEYGSLGQYTLYPTEDPDLFLGINDNYVIYYDMPVQFVGYDEETLERIFVSPILFDRLSPPLFRRGLRMSEAPPVDIDSC